MKMVKCYFNQVQVSKEPYEVDADAPNIELPIELAENICISLLDQGVIDSYCIPELIGHAVKFNT